MIRLENISFDHCIKCTVCTVYCPVTRASALYPGPKQSGPDTERLRIKNPELLDDSLKYCNNCKRCEIACPSDVRIADLIQHAKARREKGSFRPRDFLLSRTDLLGKLATPIAPLANFFTHQTWFKKALERVLKIPSQRVFPKYGWGRFDRRFRRHARKQATYNRKVVYFPGCYVNYNNHDLGFSVVKVLNALGFGVEVNYEACCGVPLIANGYMDKARDNARRNIDSLNSAAEKINGRIVSASSTCTMALRHEYRHLLEMDDGGLWDRVDYITRFIRREFDNGNIPEMKPVNLTAAYHAPCHLERMGSVLDTVDVLRRIPGLRLVLIHSECCGISGTYGFKQELYQVSQDVGADTLRRLQAVSPDVVITDCETCKWQIEMNTSLKALHPVSILARALV